MDGSVMPKVLVSLDALLLERLDREARERRVSRSAMLAELAAKGLGESTGPGARPQSRQALERIRAMFTEAGTAEDSTAVIRAMRDERSEHDARRG
jgi:metal-responsive CopG/Arc/MetJ family transcriptional regulator